jgi:hypothetical protein
LKTLWLLLAFSPAVTIQAAERDLPFPLTRNSLMKGTYVQAGDLTIVSESEIGSAMLGTGMSHEDIQRCVDLGPDWLRWSDDGRHLESTFPSSWTLTDRVLTTYCRDGFILVGGTRDVMRDGATPTRQAWIFEMVFALQSSPTKISFGPVPVGSSVDPPRYTLNELRSIDPVTGRMLYSATSADGEPVLLSAPFVVERR